MAYLETTKQKAEEVIISSDEARIAHEKSREYRESIGDFRLKEEKFRAELKNTYQMGDDEADEIIRMFKNGAIEYKIYLGYTDIIRDKLAIIREQKYTDI